MILTRKQKKVLKQCEDIQDKLPGSCAVFFPKEEDVKIYNKLVNKGLLVREPLEKGYMFSAEYNKLYVGKNNETISEKDIVGGIDG